MCITYCAQFCASVFEDRFTFQKLETVAHITVKCLVNYQMVTSEAIIKKTILKQTYELTIMIHQHTKHVIYFYIRLRTPLHATCTHNNNNNVLFV